jgi:hypothetical protein
MAGFRAPWPAMGSSPEREGGGRGRGGREEVEGDAHPEGCRRGGSAPAAATCCSWGRRTHGEKVNEEREKERREK